MDPSSNIETRPTVFIGSSSEGKEIAEAVQQNLDYDCDATVWSQGVFGLSHGTLEALVKRKEDFDFAILVLTPDDLTYSRDIQQPSPRDNVLLELGIFLGTIGRERTFAVYDRNANLKLPSDLAGVTVADYQIHADNNLRASLGAPTTQIKSAIRTLQKRTNKITTNVDSNTQFQIIHGLLDDAAQQFIIWMKLNNHALTRESELSGGIRYEFWLQKGVAGVGFFSVDEMCRKLPDADLLASDLRHNIRLTTRGKNFAQWLIENGHKATYFNTEFGGWGNRPTVMPNWPPTPYREAGSETILTMPDGPTKRLPQRKKRAANKLATINSEAGNARKTSHTKRRSKKNRKR